MKIIWCLILLFFIVTITFMAAHAEVVAFDSNGVVTGLRLKYGPLISDTGTVLSIIENRIYITHKERPTTSYPLETTIERIMKCQKIQNSQ